MATIADRSVVVSLKAETSSFIASMRAAGTATRASFDESLAGAEKSREAYTQLGAAAIGIGTAAGVGIGLAIGKFAEFDASMSGVAATGQDARASLDELRASAIAAGQDTAFSATEAADGITEMAKAGVSAQDIIGGGLAGALSLAAAGQIGVAEAAETTATALSVFNLEGDQASHVADLLAAGAGKAQGSVGDMSAALNQSALVANQLGLSIEETTGTLALFASAGLTGSDAGTSFKTMLLALSAPSSEAAALMEQLGISVYDAQGKFVGMEGIAGQLQTQMSGLDEETRNAALGTIFGSDAIRAASVLYEGGSSSVAKWTNNVNDAGYAAESAAILMDNLSGDLEQLKGSIETALISTGQASNGVLREMVQSATGLVNSYGSLGPAAHTAGLAIGVLTAGIGLASGAALLAVPRIAAFRAAVTTVDAAGAATGMTRLGTATLAAGKAFGVAAVGAGIAVGAFLAFDKLDPAQPIDELTDSLERLADTGNITGALSEIDSGLIGTVDSADDLQKVLKDAASEMNNFWDSADSLVGQSAGEDIKGIDAALSGLVATGNADQAAKAFDVFGDAATAAGLDLEDLRRLFPQYAAALDATGGVMGTARQRFLDAADAARFQREEIEGIPGSYDKVGSSATTTGEIQIMSAGLAADALAAQREEIDNLLTAYKDLNQINMSVGEAAAAQEQAVDDLASTVGRLTGAVDENGQAIDTSNMSIADIIATYGSLDEALNDNLTGFDLNTQAGRDLQDAVYGLAEADVTAAEKARDYAIAHGTEARNANEAFAASLDVSRANLSLTLQSMGLGVDAADALALAVIGVPDLRTTEMKIEDEAAQREIEAHRLRVQAIEKTWETKLNADPHGAMEGVGQANAAFEELPDSIHIPIVVTLEYGWHPVNGDGGGGIFEDLGRSAGPDFGGGSATLGAGMSAAGMDTGPIGDGGGSQARSAGSTSMEQFAGAPGMDWSQMRFQVPQTAAAAPIDGDGIVSGLSKALGGLRTAPKIGQVVINNPLGAPTSETVDQWSQERALDGSTW